MSRAENVTSLRARVKDLEAELARWKQDYKELALAVAKRDGYLPVKPAEPPVGGYFSVLATDPGITILPPTIVAAVEGTTEPFSEARLAALTAARELMEQGVTIEDVAAQIKLGAEVKV